ncbi:hypothetical protein GCM10009841_08950 [Microlunatus panaciterrae]|uniref:ABC-2 type transport system permease protein n=1 Tax=Microlunatus panaciterrae TaxID=400768 RepID=A0ABS2RMM1_9ACTN|nr:DUF6297 family protein [Microlunatus panaciterrae]MBM7799441.1 hypothetical protein [Microlunatus panaciterrae]
MSSPDTTFDDDTPTLQPASPRELKQLIKDWRTGRATKNLMEAFHDAYVVVIAALMIGAMIINVIIQAQAVVSRCDSVSCLSARAVLPWAAFAGAVAAALAVSRLFGPVLASAAEGFWLLDAPIQRSKLLAARLVGAIVGAAVIGAAAGGLISALTGSHAANVGVWAGATGAAAAAAVAFAAAQQGIERTWLARTFTYIFGTLGLAALLLVISVAAGWLSLGLSSDLGVELGLVMTGFGILVLAASAVLAGLRLNRIRRTRLLSGGALVSGISGAFFALDIGLARDIVVERRAVEKGHVHPKRGGGLGLQAIVWRELHRLLRFPQPLIAVGATLVVPYAADALGMSSLTPVFAGLALFGAMIPLLGGLRVLTRTGGLARCLPFSPGAIKRASVAVPAGIAAIWALATTAAFVGFGEGAVDRTVPAAFLMALATASAGFLGAVRWTMAKGVDFGAPMVSTQAGAFPPGLMTNLFRGFDVCLLITAPMLLGLSPIWSFVIAGIAALLLFGSFDAEAMRAKQAEQQRQLAEQKAKAAKASAAAQQRKR